MNSESLLLLLSSLGVVQSIFLSIYLLSVRQGHRLANITFALLMLSYAVRIGKSIFNHFLDIESTYRNIGLSAQLTTGPLLWFYGLLILQVRDRFTKSYLWHLAPAFVLALLAPIIPNERGDTISRVVYVLVLMHLAGYLFLSLRTWQVHTDAETSIERDWYRKVLGAVMGLFIFYTAIFFKLIPSYISGAIFYTFLVYAMTYLALNRATLFTFEKVPSKQGNAIPDKNELEDVLARIHQKMEIEHAFLDPDMTVVGLARSIQSSARLVSRAINESTGKNFNEYINSYRIAHAKKLLAADPKAKASLIAYDCGFNSVSSFYTAFRQNTGTTPHQFRQPQEN